MDASETVSGKRGRAPAEGVMNSDIPTQWLGKKYRAGDLHLASVADKEEARGHAQWRHSDMKGEIAVQSRKDRGVSFDLDGGGPVLSARVASFGTGFDEGGRQDARGPSDEGARRGIGHMKAVQSPGIWSTLAGCSPGKRWTGGRQKRRAWRRKGSRARISETAMWISRAVWAEGRHICN